MIDTPVQRLIERAIDSPLKLQLLLLFSEHTHFEGTAAQIAQRTFRDIGSTCQALRELVDDGILTTTQAIEPVYHYRPRPDLVDPILRLYRIYNEPLERDSIQQYVREVEIFAAHRRSGAHVLEYDHMAITG